MYRLLLLFLALIINSCAFRNIFHRSSPSSLSSTSPAVPNFDATPISVSGSLIDFLKESETLGAVRFVVVGNGAILETVGSFSNLRFAETVKGKLATLSTESPNFECHIRLAEVKEVKMLSLKKMDRILYISRFLDASGTTLLSSILHGDENIGQWTKMKERFCKQGESFFI